MIFLLLEISTDRQGSCVHCSVEMSPSQSLTCRLHPMKLRTHRFYGCAKEEVTHILNLCGHLRKHNVVGQPSTSHTHPDCEEAALPGHRVSVKALLMAIKIILVFMQSL